MDAIKILSKYCDTQTDQHGQIIIYTGLYFDENMKIYIPCDADDNAK